MIAPARPLKPVAGRPELVVVRCPIRRCDCVLGMRRADWRGDPEWIKCRKCGTMVRVDGAGSRAVARAGDD